jgi:hypothetical protein
MPPRKKATPKVEQPNNEIENAAPAQEVDQTVINQENSVDNAVDRTPESEKSQAEDTAIKDAAPANDVDVTVENQEQPGKSEEDRSEDAGDPDEDPERTKAWDTMAPAQEVDETVQNQMNPGVNMVDRQPERQLVEDSAGIVYDVSKSVPELVDADVEERETEKARIRQQEAVLNPAEWREDDEDKTYIVLVFVNTGLLGLGKVWKKGETLKVAGDQHQSTFDTNGNSWLDLSASEQEDRYGRVMFERE